MAKSIKKLLKSFTLIELIIVIAIIAVLGASAFLLLTQWMSKGRDAQRISDLSTIKTALDIALTKNDELPLPDEAKELLYTGTEILYQGVFGDQVVKSIGTLNKVPKDRQTGEYEYSLLYDKKSYRIKAVMENEQYQLSYFSQAKASEDVYRYVGRDIKAVVIENTFVYLPSMFITGFNEEGKFDLYGTNMDVFVGEKVGEYKSGFALPVDQIDQIKSKLTQLGLEESNVNQIVAQGTGQPQIIAQSTDDPQIVVEEKCDGTLPVNAVLNGNLKSGIEYSYNETPGECTFKCNDGYYFDESQCKQIYSWSGDSFAGFVFLNQGVTNYPKSCNDLKLSTTPNFKIDGGAYNGSDFVNGVYWIKPNASQAFKVFCNMATDGGGWTILANNDNADNEPTGCYAKIASKDTLVCGDGFLSSSDFAVPSWGIDLNEIVWATYTGQNFFNVTSYNYGKITGGYTIPNLTNFAISYTSNNQTVDEWLSIPKITANGKNVTYIGNKNSLAYLYGTNVVTVMSTNVSMNPDNLSFTDGFSDGTVKFSPKGFDDFQDGSGCADVREPKAVRGQSSYIMVR